MREWITRRLVRAFLRDVNDFFYDAERRELMCESVRERMRVGGGPFVVVAHSQGSMIAYQVLSELDPASYQVDLFVTIGSPLGIQEVQDQLKRITGQNRLAIPRCVGRWLNVADPLDPVALDKRLGGEYRGNVELKDMHVVNPDSPRHPHSGSGYLRTNVVRDAVAKSVETGLFQRVAPFVIARDMARRLENHPSTTRHKVLIELALADEKAHGTARLRDTGDRLENVLRAIAVERGISDTDMNIDRMQRWIAAELTREETEMLAQRGRVRGDLLQRIWRNSTKRVLLDVSCQTVQARTAHAGYGATGRGIGWAVLDTGIAPHPHFNEYGNIATQVDCTRRGAPRPGTALDENGHGTHVAGIVAGIHRFKVPGQADRVFSGLAPEARLHVYKTLNKDGEGDDAWIIKALDHISQVNEDAGELRIHGVNLSLGGSFDQSVYGCGHTPLCRELRRLWRQGVVVVLAAGNEGFAVLQTLEGTIDANMDLSIGDPANLEEAIAVGSVHKESPQRYGISWFSSRGPTADGRQKPDLVAPGERILSCRHDIGGGSATIDELYVEMGGTSMAAPHVSGLIAGFLSVRPGFVGDPDAVKRILLDNCTDLQRDRAQQGAGLANLTRMLLNT
jgi:subtilisin family serine protease